MEGASPRTSQVVTGRYRLPRGDPAAIEGSDGVPLPLAPQRTVGRLTPAVPTAAGAPPPSSPSLPPGVLRAPRGDLEASGPRQRPSGRSGGVGHGATWPSGVGQQRRASAGVSGCRAWGVRRGPGRRDARGDGGPDAGSPTRPRPRPRQAGCRRLETDGAHAAPDDLQQDRPLRGGRLDALDASRGPSTTARQRRRPWGGGAAAGWRGGRRSRRGGRAALHHHRRSTLLWPHRVGVTQRPRPLTAFITVTGVADLSGGGSGHRGAFVVGGRPRRRLSPPSSASGQAVGSSTRSSILYPPRCHSPRSCSAVRSAVVVSDTRPSLPPTTGRHAPRSD